MNVCTIRRTVLPLVAASVAVVAACRKNEPAPRDARPAPAASGDFDTITFASGGIDGSCSFVLHASGEASVEATQPCGSDDVGTFAWRVDEPTMASLRDELSRVSLAMPDGGPPLVVDAPATSFQISYAGRARGAMYAFAPSPGIAALDGALRDVMRAVQLHPIRAFRVELSEGTARRDGSVALTLAIRSTGSEPARLGNPARGVEPSTIALRVLGGRMVNGAPTYSAGAEQLSIERLGAHPGAPEPAVIEVAPGGRETYRIRARVRTPLPDVVGLNLRLEPPALSGDSTSLHVGSIAPPHLDVSVAP